MNYQKLFDYFHEQHGISLFETDMQEIVRIVKEMEESEVKAPICPIIDVGGLAIDFRTIEYVGPVWGDPQFLRYRVYFKSGTEVEIYEKRKNSETNASVQVEREKFIELWRSVSLNPHA